MVFTDSVAGVIVTILLNDPMRRVIAIGYGMLHSLSYKLVTVYSYPCPPVALEWHRQGKRLRTRDHSARAAAFDADFGVPRENQGTY